MDGWDKLDGRNRRMGLAERLRGDVQVEREAWVNGWLSEGWMDERGTGWVGRWPGWIDMSV